MCILGTINTFLNLWRAQECAFGKCGRTIVTTDATYQQIEGGDHNTIAVGSVAVDQTYHCWCQCVASKENTVLHTELFTTIFKHAEEVVREAQRRCKENNVDVSESTCELGKRCFGFNANEDGMSDLIPIVTELLSVPEWTVKIDILVVDGQKAPRIALRELFPEMQIIDCARHFFAALRRSIVGSDSKLKTKDEKEEMRHVISAICGMHELASTRMQVTSK